MAPTEAAMEAIFKKDPEIKSAQSAADTAYLTSMRNLLEKSELSDLTIRCGKDFKVHRSVLVCQSSFFANALKHDTKEAQSRVIELEEDEPHVVAAMIEFLYTQGYTIKDAPSDEKPLEFELKMNAIADKLYITPLMALAQARFHIRANASEVSELLDIAERAREQEFGPFRVHRRLLAKILVHNSKRVLAEENEERIAEAFGTGFEVWKECRECFQGKQVFHCNEGYCRHLWVANSSDTTAMIRCPKCTISQDSPRLLVDPTKVLELFGLWK